MKAIVCKKYGSADVLEVAEVERPEPKPDEVLIRMVASTVSAADGMIRRGKPYYGRLFLGLFKPKNPIPGTSLAGVVEATGKDVTRFEVGDSVFGETALGFSTHAEYVCVPQDGVLMKKPQGLPFEEVAGVSDGALTSANFLYNLGRVHAGKKVLINGAAGGLGTAAVQIAKIAGAEVTAVCSGRNASLVRSLGADHVIDYTKQDFTASDEKWDIVFDTVGKSSFARSRRVLTADGAYLSPVLGIGLLLRMIWTARFGRKKAKFAATGLMAADELRDLLADITQSLSSGQLTSVIDRVYTLDNAAAAHRYVDKGHKVGNVVLSIAASADKAVAA